MARTGETVSAILFTKKINVPRNFFPRFAEYTSLKLKFIEIEFEEIAHRFNHVTQYLSTSLLYMEYYE